MDCLGCAREKGEIDKGAILKTKYFDAHQDYEVPIPGFIIVSTRRHIMSVSEFTKEEQAEFLKIVAFLRNGMKKVLGIDVVHIFQDEETSHHFHLWMFPRYVWMEEFGKKIQSVRPIMEYAKKNDVGSVDDALEKMRAYAKDY